MDFKSHFLKDLDPNIVFTWLSHLLVGDTITVNLKHVQIIKLLGLGIYTIATIRKYPL